MRVLIISQFFPYPPYNGGRMRIYQLLSGLAARHEVHLLTFSHDQKDAEYLGNLSGICAGVNMVSQKRAPALSARSILGYLSPAPRSYVADWSPEMQRLVDELTRELDFDAALVCGLRNAGYVSRLDRVAKLLDNENCDTAFAVRLAEIGGTPIRRFRRRLTSMKSEMYERKLASQFDAVLAVSDDDKNAIARIAPALADRDAIHVIPNGTDLALLDFRGPDVDMKKILSPGALTYSANYDAAVFFSEQVFPLIKRKTPEARFVITGGTNGVDLAPFQDVEGLTLTGYLDDVRPEVASSAVVVVPARIGGGTRLKILEAMALGVPVVATTFGAMGLDGVNGEHLFITDDPTEFAEHVLLLMEDLDLRRRMTSAARSFVSERFGWDSISARLNGILESTVKTIKDTEQCAKA